MDSLLEEIHSSGIRPKLLLHSCCAPCSSYVLEYLSPYFEIVDFYYNPNISPEEEYYHRVDEMQRLIKEMLPDSDIRFVEGMYDHDRYLETVKGLEGEPEGGARCEKCFRLRLQEAALAAKEFHCDYFATTLTISPLKNPDLINSIGFEIARETGVRYLASDFKKKEGYKRSIELSQQYRLYRQNYCGCIYSQEESENKRSSVV
jgi:predicted adenine nucleotide alpha hydrolase (AANH) superfamily ATPase